MLRIIRYFLWTVLVLIALAITSLNADPVVLNYYRSTISLPLSLLLLLSFTTGWLLGLGFNVIHYIKLKSLNRHLQQRCQQTQLEIEQLKQHDPHINTTFQQSAKQ